LVRRRLRHVCAGCVESFIPGDYIFVARPGSPEISQDALAVELFSAREKLYSRLPKEQSTAATVELVSAETIDGVDATSGVSESPIIAVATTHAGTDSDEQPVSLAVRMIRIYQMISRNTPSTCRYYPSCSEFMAQAMMRYGTWQGLWMGLRRITRCHPFAKGGHDPVP
jgi:putative membrane protein insertion efficiency factor